MDKKSKLSSTLAILKEAKKIAKEQGITTQEALMTLQIEEQRKEKIEISKSTAMHGFALFVGGLFGQIASRHLHLDLPSVVGRKNPIPEISTQHIEYYTQPDPSNFTFHENSVMVSEQDFKELMKFDINESPSKAPGKMWKSYDGVKWILFWYSEDLETKDLDII